ncbi:1840_t:CDS:10 [Acaulospora colombiana]|uniref:1840_t:CDS:1 n=1 Tax=Acaulospora colombiana TaxID=27376 RepID=A0ACA9KF69_9GLOM|nr:1840_t:CDS:10 [Acaulospora colombiana]
MSTECPELIAHWFHAIDVPRSDPIKKSTTNIVRSPQEAASPTVPKTKQPSNWVPFSKRDNAALEQAFKSGNPKQVPCNEDYLFEVDIDKREIRPIYWLGPVYEVKRATWFQQGDGGKFFPCDENLATQIEEGYRNRKVWLPHPDPDPNNPNGSEPVEKSCPLFGKYLSQYVTYTNQTTAWLLTDDVTGRFTKTLFSTLTNNVNLGGIRLVRGYNEVKKYTSQNQKDGGEKKKKEELDIEIRSVAASDDQVKERDIKQEFIESQDYENEESEEEERAIDHLILVIHGIGQKLSERMDAINFVHDVNVLRKTIKTIFKTNPEVFPHGSHTRTGSNANPSKRNSAPSEKGAHLRNGVQVLPIQWRQEIKFGMASEDENIQRDLGMPEVAEEGQTTLDEITLDGVPTLRMLISDVLMDVLLYMTPRYREVMISTVTNEANRVYNAFIQRNPKFLENGGRVSIYGHSLGSVLAFDVLCHQPPIVSSTAFGIFSETAKTSNVNQINHDSVKLCFKVHNFFASGSPIGLFLLLKGLKISSRKNRDKENQGQMIAGAAVQLGMEVPSSVADHIPLCYPAARNIYNIFHNADPIAYRLEPLIARNYGSGLKPALIPYHKGGLRAVHLGIQEFGNDLATKATNIFSTVRTSLIFTKGLQVLGANPSHKRSASTPVTNADNETSGSALTNYPPTLFAQPTSASEKEKEDPEGAEKLKSLNCSGRIDYVLQEGILDVGYINAITVHLSYWSDLDAVSFILKEIYRECPDEGVDDDEVELCSDAK